MFQVRRFLAIPIAVTFAACSGGSSKGSSSTGGSGCPAPQIASTPATTDAPHAALSQVDVTGQGIFTCSGNTSIEIPVGFQSGVASPSSSVEVGGFEVGLGNAIGDGCELGPAGLQVGNEPATVALTRSASDVEHDGALSLVGAVRDSTGRWAVLPTSFDDRGNGAGIWSVSAGKPGEYAFFALASATATPATISAGQTATISAHEYLPAVADGDSFIPAEGVALHELAWTVTVDGVGDSSAGSVAGSCSDDAFQSPQSAGLQQVVLTASVPLDDGGSVLLEAAVFVAGDARPPECTPGETSNDGCPYCPTTSTSTGGGGSVCGMKTCNAYSRWDACSGCFTPLVFSFDGARVAFSNQASAAFDLAGVDQPVAVDWPSAATPWLAMDRNGNGRIDDGAELFGSMTRLPNGGRARDGFEALAALDTNHDGRIDARDLAWSGLVLWADRDGIEIRRLMS